LKETTLNQLLEAETSDFVPGGIIIGTLTGLDSNGRALVTSPDDPSRTLEALTTVPITSQLIGRQVALLFGNSDPRQPVIVGVIQNPLIDLLEQSPEPDLDKSAEFETEPDAGFEGLKNELYIDGKKILIDAAEEIVLKCGEASITLTKSGKILIRGKYVLNRSSGVHRIMGGSVQIN
jgi:hypothetical protein